MLRMETYVFITLGNDLMTEYGLKSTIHVSGLESLAMFLWTCGHNQTFRNVSNRFQHSMETVSRKFHEVLEAVLHMKPELVKMRHINIIQDVIRNRDPFWPAFGGCIGAIDGTHIPIEVPVSDQEDYMGRKGYTTQNILAVIDFDLMFVFVSAGNPGSYHDAFVLRDTVGSHSSFPKPPHGYYYVVDAGYANVSGYLAPFRGTRYHTFRGGPSPQGLKEKFNQVHLRLRNVVERGFGVWKKRWAILKNMNMFEKVTCAEIVGATMTLHNYIQMHGRDDSPFNRCDMDPNFVPGPDFYNSDVQNDIVTDEDAAAINQMMGAGYDMGEVRNNIANYLVNQ